MKWLQLRPSLVIFGRESRGHDHVATRGALRSAPRAISATSAVNWHCFGPLRRAPTHAWRWRRQEQGALLIVESALLLCCDCAVLRAGWPCQSCQSATACGHCASRCHAIELRDAATLLECTVLQRTHPRGGLCRRNTGWHRACTWEEAGTQGRQTKPAVRTLDMPTLARRSTGASSSVSSPRTMS